MRLNWSKARKNTRLRTAHRMVKCLRMAGKKRLSARIAAVPLSVKINADNLRLKR